jgi:hypothetical protein
MAVDGMESWGGKPRSRVFLIDRINPSAGVLLRGRGPMHKGMLIGLNPLIIPQDFDALAHSLCEGLIF